MVCDKCGIENAPLVAAKLAARGVLGWYFTVLKKYAVFAGRAGRKEFWYFFLFNNLILIALTTLSSLSVSANGPSLFSVLAAVYAIGTMVPALAVSVRRLHDVNFSGWLVLIVFIPVVGAIILLVLCAADSKPGESQYGPSPKTGPPLSVLNTSPAADSVVAVAAHALDAVLVPSGRLRPEEEPTPSRQVGVSTQLEAQCSAPPTTPRPRAHEVEPHGSGLESGNLDSGIAPTRPVKLLKIGGVVAVIVAAAFACLLLMKPFIRYKFLNERNLQFRYDRFSGRTDQLVPTEGWVPVSFDRPSKEIPVANINLSRMRWFGNQICAEVNNESDYVVKSVIVQMCVSAKGCDPADQWFQTQNGAPTLSLEPDGYLLQKGETGRFCAETEEAAYPAYTVLGAKGWKEK